MSSTTIILLFMAVVRVVLGFKKRAKFKAQNTDYSGSNLKIQKLQEGVEGLHSKLVKKNPRVRDKKLEDHIRGLDKGFVVDNSSEYNKMFGVADRNRKRTEESFSRKKDI